MSYRKEKSPLVSPAPKSTPSIRQALQGECANLCWTNKMHGICFSPYEGEQQDPGDPISEEQVRRKLALLQPHTRNGSGSSPAPKATTSFRSWPGSMASRRWSAPGWARTMRKTNEEDGRALDRAGPAQGSWTLLAAVGNEVLYREEMEEADLLACILTGSGRPCLTRPRRLCGRLLRIHQPGPTGHGGVRCGFGQLLPLLGGMPHRLFPACT